MESVGKERKRVRNIQHTTLQLLLECHAGGEAASLFVRAMPMIVLMMVLRIVSSWLGKRFQILPFFVSIEHR